MGEEARYVARYASVYVKGDSFTEVGNVLAERGFDMVRATQTEHGVLVIPHKEDSRQAARLFAEVSPVEAVALEDKGLTWTPTSCVCDDFRQQYAGGVWPLPQWTCPSHGQVHVTPNGASVEVAAAVHAGAEVESGAVEPIPLTCGECGTIHSEGVVCLIPVMFERNCCNVVTYGHEGPHEAWFKDPQTGTIMITHRWEVELVVTDLPFNAYGHYDEELDGDDR